MESVIRNDHNNAKCVCCRAYKYYNIVMQTAAFVPDETFKHLGKAFGLLLKPVREHYEQLDKSMPAAEAKGSSVASKYTRKRVHKHKQHGLNKAAVRELADAETRMLVALHFNPFVRGLHYCFLKYESCFEYGLDLAGHVNEAFLCRQTQEYVRALEAVRFLFE
jgi:hypothetical protein